MYRSHGAQPMFDGGSANCQATHMENATPYHQNQIQRRIPAWAKQLHPRHLDRVLQSAHNEHVDEDGTPTGWFAKASALQQQLLRDAIKVRTATRKTLGQALIELRSLPQFCEPLLQQQLAIDVPVTQAQYCFQPFVTYLSGSLETVPGLESLDLGGGAYEPQWISEPVGASESRSLLEAAMHNFEGMSEVGPFSTLQVNANDASTLPGLSMARFVSSCRALDLGERYQAHLDNIFNGQHKVQVQDAWIQAHRAMLTVKAVIALIRGELSSLGYQALRHFCIDGATPRYGSQPVTLRNLTVLGKKVHGALLLGPAGTDAEIVAYLPFDDRRPMQEFANLQQLQTYLAGQLLDAQYCQRFVEHVAHSDQKKMSEQLIEQLYEDDTEFHGVGGLIPLEPLWPAAGYSLQGKGPRASPDLGIRQRQVDLPYWNSLYDNHVAFLKDNARAIAVPTADVNAKLRKERLAFWEEAGLNLLNVAAMLVPGLDAVMLLVFAAQVLDNVYLAYEAWSEGDYAEAVAQLKALALTAGSIMVIGAAAKVVKASGFVDWLERVVLGGEELLWHPQITPYHSQVELSPNLEPDAEGIYEVDDRHYVRLDGKTCEVHKNAAGAWELVHASDQQGYRPVLHGNGKGAWRLAHEQVRGWGRTRLLRRMGPVTEGQSDADLAAAFDSTGLEQGVLEPVLADGEPVPTQLDDALLRLNKDMQVTDIIARTRNGRPLAAYKSFAITALGELPGWPEDVVLKVFEGPEAWGGFSLYGREHPGDQVIELTRNDLDNGDLADRVLEQLDEARITRLLPAGTAMEQRQQALQDLLADHLSSRRSSLFDSLYKSQQPPLSPAARALARQVPAGPDNALEEIVGATRQAERTRLLNGRVPLRVAQEARAMQTNVRLGRALLGMYRPSLANADTHLIRDSLLALHPDWTEPQLYQAAIADRAQAARLIGQQPVRRGVRSPMRLSDGRYGYPLSPGVFASREERELHTLFPGMNDRERRQLLATLRARGNVTEQIQAYRTELGILRDGLDDWITQQAPHHQRHANQVASTLIRTWHRLEGDSLRLANLELDSLPPLSTRFDHVRTLFLDNLDVPTIPADYLQSFPSLRRVRVISSPALGIDSLFEALHHTPALVELSIESSGLRQLPAQAHQALPTLTQLRFLALRRNELALTDEDFVRLSASPQLRFLDLYQNRIEMTPGMAARFGTLTELRELNLGNNPLGISPNLRNLRCLSALSLENCELVHWPEGLQTLMGRTNHALRQVELSRNQIEHVPDLDILLETPFVEALLTGRGSERWRFNYNPLDEGTRRQLRAAGVVVARPVMEAPLLPGERPRNWLQPTDQAQRTTWDSLFAEDANPSLREAVEQAGLSSAAHANAHAMTRQIWRLLLDAAADSELCARLNEVAALFPVSCGDAGADVLSSLQIEARVWRMTAGQPQATHELFTYFQSLYRRDQVNALAQELYSARLHRRTGLLARQRWEALPAAQRGLQPSVSALHRFDWIPDNLLLENQGLDLIEMRLVLRTNLAEELDYTEPQMQMLYRDAAHIVGPTEDAVLQEVLTRNNDLPARRQWVSRQPSWRRVLRVQFPARFEALRPRWDVGIDFLEWCNDGSPMEGTLETPVIDALTSALGVGPLDEHGQVLRLAINGDQYVSGMNRMAQGLEDDEDSLSLELTKPLDSDD